MLTLRWHELTACPPTVGHAPPHCAPTGPQGKGPVGGGGGGTATQLHAASVVAPGGQDLCPALQDALG